MRKTFLLLFVCFVTSSVQAQATENPPSPSPAKVEIGYASPAAALAALREKPGVKIREENDWYVANDPNEKAFWSITQPAHPAHPTAVKRVLVDGPGGIHLAMAVKCGASKSACDQVVFQFKQINESLGRSPKRQ